ncbi:MAG: LysR substrate-binding domain-containing protein, partial [Faecousia sp.]
VEQNMGIAFLPDYVTEEGVRAGKLVRLNVVDFPMVIWKQLLYRRDKWVSLPMRAMIDHLTKIRLNGKACQGEK